MTEVKFTIQPWVMDVLYDCEDYFDNLADADCDQDGYIPNEEMKILTMIREVIALLGVKP